MEQQVNWKKIVLFSTVAAFAPSLNTWAECAKAGQICPFTFGTIVTPAIPSLILTLAALFTKPFKG